MPILNSMAQKSTNPTRARAFKSAQTHSKRVRWFKRILPLGALAIVALVGATAVLSRAGLNIAIDLPNTTISEGKLVMANPNLDGFTSDERPFRVTAVRAIQDLEVQEALELEQLSAKVELEDGQSVQLTSSTGTFDSNANRLVLPNEAVLTTTDGVRATMGQADINIKTGSVAATDSVQIVGSETSITAQAMQIDQGGKRILFEENVRLVLKPKADIKVMENEQASRPANNAQNADVN